MRPDCKFEIKSTESSEEFKERIITDVCKRYNISRTCVKHVLGVALHFGWHVGGDKDSSVGFQTNHDRSVVWVCGVNT